MKRAVKDAVIFIMIGLVVSGCYSLRKKFVRKRRHNIPPPVYLDLKEYPKVPTKEMYDEYYVFIKGWLDELIRCLENDYGKKRQKKSINEAIENLKQIVYFFTPQGKEKVQSLYEEMLAIKKRVERPYLSYSDRNFIIRKTQKLKRRLETEFTYEKAKQWLNQE